METADRIRHTTEFNSYLLPDLRFLEAAVESGVRYFNNAAWSTDLEEIPEVPNFEILIASSDNGRRCNTYRRYAGSLAFLCISIRNGEASVNIAAESAELRDEIKEMVYGLIPHSAPAGNQEIPVTFWHHTNRGPASVVRRLEAPAWEQVQNNYSAPVKDALQTLVEAHEPKGGKLLLWSGHPGTGKTYALRSLVWEWRDWVDAHYLIDPERFFGDAPGDLMEVIIGEDERHWTPSRKKQQDRRWKLIILEDTGEMLAADAKTRVGQGLSRLLNIVDGMLGQGLKTLILITTNEELGTLHPAVTRPGRCWSHVKFEPLTQPEARAWLASQNCDQPYTGFNYLADLYGHVNAWTQRPKKSAPIGFI